MPKLTMIEGAQRARIKPTDIKFLVDRLNNRREEGEDTGFESQCFILLEQFGKRKKPEKMFATMERMHCLLKILSDERMRGWTIDIKEPGCTLINGSVFAAIATCTLRHENETFFFDPDEFFDIALKEMPSEGRA